MTVSIIIATKTWQRNLEECVGKCLKLDYPDFEILILPDSPIKGQQGQSPSGTVPVKESVLISIIPSGPINPADKRDLALKYAKGEILAFIDDDAYPVENWLKNALENFKDDRVAAVGGPAITPLEDSLKQQASGRIYESFLVSGNFNYRYIPGEKREVDDLPSCNFLVRKSVMQELGGFDTKFWPGEDTKLCLDIVKRLRLKIIYDPKVLVYHHRRPIFKPHLKQIANYALHRGYFVKKYPQTSLRLSYFIPTLFLLALTGGILLSFLWPSLSTPFILSLFLYFILVFLSSISGDLRLIAPVFFGTILTHLTYGLYFLGGLLSKKLPEEINNQ